MQIWDVGNQANWRVINNASHYRCQACVMMYDITDAKSFKDAKDIKIMFDRQNIIDPAMYLVGNKQDLVNKDPSLRQVSYEEGLSFAKENDIGFMEISAMDDINIS